MQRLNCGEFAIGNREGSRNSQSRFIWKVSLVSVGKTATEEASKVEEMNETTPEENEEADQGFLTHSFHLRPDLILNFDLPLGITELESIRLSEFIKSLPLRRE